LEKGLVKEMGVNRSLPSHSRFAPVQNSDVILFVNANLNTQVLYVWDTLAQQILPFAAHTDAFGWDNQ